MYKISMIIPIFNVEDCLSIAMDSLINQTIGFENIEAILVDDCSTDNSRKIIQYYVDKYPNCKKIFLSKNSGNAGKPRNEGIKIATAPYLMFMDPDDEYTPNACETFYNKIVETQVDFVHANWTEDTYGLLTPTEHPFMKKDELFIFKNNENIKNYHKYFRPGMCAAIYDTEFILSNMIFCSTELGEDLYFALDAIFKANCVIFLASYSDSYLNKMRDTEDNISITNKRDIEHFESRLNSIHILLNLLNSFPIENNFYVLNKEFQLVLVQYFTLLPNISFNYRVNLGKKIWSFERDILEFLDFNIFFSFLNFFIIHKFFKFVSLISYIMGYFYNKQFIRIIFRKYFSRLIF